MAQPSLAPIETYATLDSTSLEAKQRVEDGATGPLWIHAIEQTAGYGRRGTPWRQSTGDLAASRLFTLAPPSDNPGQLAFVAAVAVAEAIRALAPSIDLRLKWPNDILVERRKLAGLLCELVEAHADRQVVSLGVGLNILNVPQTAEIDAARLNDYASTAVSPVELLEQIERAFAAWLKVWRRDGFEPVRVAWLSDAFGLGKHARVVGAGNDMAGVIKGIDADGALLLDTVDGRKRVTAGSLIVETA